MKRDYRLFIEDILESIERIEEFVGDMDFEEFSRDDKTRSAVVRKLEIIGEASENIPRRLREKYGALPWSDMARMRDKIIHWYFGINYRIVWEVIKERLPEIKPVIQKMLRRWRDRNGNAFLMAIFKKREGSFFSMNWGQPLTQDKS